MGVLLSSSSREERVERNRDTMVRSSLGVSLKRGIFRRRRYRTTRGCCYFCFCDETQLFFLWKRFFLRTHRCWLFKNTTSWILWWFWVSFRSARNIICHPRTVDLMINETIYYTTRVDDIFTSSSKSFSVSKRNPQSRWTIKILWTSTFKPYLCF